MVIMKKILVCLALICSVVAEEDDELPKCREKKAGYTSRDATVLSVIGWGISIVVAIATFTALVKNNDTTTPQTGS
jgi:hypothetical protein